MTQVRVIEVIFSMPDSLTSVGGSDYTGCPIMWWRGEACRVHSRIEVAWRDGRGLALAQLLDHGQHFLHGQAGCVMTLTTQPASSVLRNRRSRSSSSLPIVRNSSPYSCPFAHRTAAWSTFSVAS